MTPLCVCVPPLHSPVRSAIGGGGVDASASFTRGATRRKSVANQQSDVANQTLIRNTLRQQVLGTGAASAGARAINKLSMADADADGGRFSVLYTVYEIRMFYEYCILVRLLERAALRDSRSFLIHMLYFVLLRPSALLVLVEMRVHLRDSSSNYSESYICKKSSQAQC